MKLMRKELLILVIIILAGCLCWVVLGNLSASDEVRPTSTRSTPYTMKVENLHPKARVFTEFYFAPNVKEGLNVSIALQAADESPCKAKIYLFQVGMDENTDSFTTEEFRGNTLLSHTFTGLSSNAFYFLCIENISGGVLAKEPSLNGSLTVG